MGGYGTMNQGCNGGDGHYDDGSNNNHTGHRGGGGGGAGTPGRSWHVNLHRNNWKAFEGGDGRACSITGSQVYYGGGGGGSGIVSSYLYAIVTASGGLGGGGNGGITNSGSSAVIPRGVTVLRTQVAEEVVVGILKTAVRVVRESS